MKKLVSMLVVLTMLLGLMMPASAAALESASGVTRIYTITNDAENDVVTVQYTSKTGKIESYDGAVSAESPKEYLFEYTNGDTKYSYSVLDKDSAGNYLILAADRYGQLTLNQDKVNNLFDPDPFATYQTTTWTDADGNPVDIKEAGWDSDTNIATWLNNDFYNGYTGEETGATGVIKSVGSLTKLDTRIKDYIVTHDWITEGNNQGANYAKKLTGAAKSAYKINCRIALMSATEYISYRDKIGYAGYKSDGSIPESGGEILRSPDQNGANNIKAVRILADNKGGVTNYGSTDYSGLYFRPMFYVSRDYFIKNKLENPGTEVVEMLKNDFSYGELSGVYTAEELKAMGVENKAIRSADNGRTDTAMLAITKTGEDGAVTEGTKVDVGKGIIDEENGTPLSVAVNAPEAYVFTHTNADDNKTYSYSILDKDENGNYYVYANNRYGKVTATAAPINNVFDPNMKDTYAALEYTNAEGKVDTSKWSDVNIALYLNTDFIDGTEVYGTISQSDGRALEKTIKDNLVEHDWYMEGNGQIDNAEEGIYMSAYHMNSVTTSDYIAKARVGMLSWSEYIKYSQRIGYKTIEAPGDTATMVLLRTANDLNYTGLYYIRELDGGILTCNPVSTKYNSQWLRPSFWLSRDYFRTVKLNSAGAEVVEILNRDYTYDELLTENGGAYTEEELKAMGVAPLIGNAVIDGEVMSFDLYNSTEADVTPVVMLAGYDESGALKAVTYDDTQTIAAGGKKEYYFDFTSEYSEGSFKILVFEGTDSLKPFCRVITKDDFDVLPAETANAAAISAEADAEGIVTVRGAVDGAEGGEIGVVTVSDTDGGVLASDYI